MAGVSVHYDVRAAEEAVSMGTHIVTVLNNGQAKTYKRSLTDS